MNSTVIPDRLATLTMSVALFLLSVFSAPACCQTSNSGASGDRTKALTSADAVSLREALSAYDGGRSDEARATLENLLRRYPANFEATETLGMIYAEGGNWDAAVPLLRNACKLRPSSAIAYANLGTAYLKQGRSHEAVRPLQKSAALNPKNVEAQSALGQAFMLTGHPAESAKAFSLAAAGNPENSDILYNWALSTFQSGDSALAARILSRIPHQETAPQVQSLLGDIEEKQGHFEAAVQHLKLAANLDPSEPNLYALGLEFARHWTFDAAIKVYQFGLTRYPASSRLQLGLAVAKYGNNDYSGAAPIFANLLSEHPESNLYADLLGHSCSVIAEQQTTGCDQLQIFAAQHPENAVAAAEVAAGILKQPDDRKNSQKAENLLQQAIKADPRYAGAYLQMAILDQQQMRWQESIGMLQRAIALEPSSADAHFRLSRAYAHLGKSEDAQREIQLQRKYAEEEKGNLNARLRQVTTFLVTLQ